MTALYTCYVNANHIVNYSSIAVNWPGKELEVKMVGHAADRWLTGAPRVAPDWMAMNRVGFLAFYIIQCQFLPLDGRSRLVGNGVARWLTGARRVAPDWIAMNRISFQAFRTMQCLFSPLDGRGRLVGNGVARWLTGHDVVPRNRLDWAVHLVLINGAGRWQMRGCADGLGLEGHSEKTWNRFAYRLIYGGGKWADGGES